MALALALGFGTQPFPSATEAWCAPADLADCVAPGHVDVATVCSVASNLLRNLSGRRFGVRRLTARPHRLIDTVVLPGVSPTPTGTVLTSSSGWWGQGWGWMEGRGLLLDGPAAVREVVLDGNYLAPAYNDGTITSGQTSLTSPHARFIGSDVAQAVTGPGIPVGTTVASVAGNTATLSAAATATGTIPFVLPARAAGWYLYDGRLLVRANGVDWPYDQDLSMPLTSPGTWAVTFESGVQVPVEAKEAAKELACQLLKLIVGSPDCAIPDRVTSLTRQGVSLTILDPNDFLKEGRTGIYMVDLWLASLVAQRRMRRATIAGPESYRDARQ